MLRLKLLVMPRAAGKQAGRARGRGGRGRGRGPVTDTALTSADILPVGLMNGSFADGSSRSPSELELSDACRLLQRRDTDDQALRIIATKFKNIREEIIASAVNSQGTLFMDHLKSQIRDCRQYKKRISTQFWVRCYKDFPALTSATYACLPEPPSGESVDTAILERLTLLHNASPALRRADPLEKLIYDRKLFNQTEIIGILKSIAEGPVVSRSYHVRLAVAMASYFARITLRLISVGTKSFL